MLGKPSLSEAQARYDMNHHKVESLLDEMEKSDNWNHERLGIALVRERMAYHNLLGELQENGENVHLKAIAFDR